MIPTGVEIFVGLEPIDLRWGFERLSGIALEKIGREARCGALFVFFGKRRTALKVLFFEQPQAAAKYAIWFHQEARALAALDHPAIVHARDFGTLGTGAPPVACTW